MIWTQEQRDEMIALWDNGKRSYSQIAEIMGVSKNSVVGRMRREKAIRGLPVEDKHAHRTRTGKVFVKTEKKPTVAKRAGYIIAHKAPPLFPKPDEGQLASIVDVTGCRWAVSYSDTAPGGHLFCNHATEDGQSYCPYHQHENVAAYSRALIAKTTRAAWHAYQKKVAA